MFLFVSQLFRGLVVPHVFDENKAHQNPLKHAFMGEAEKNYTASHGFPATARSCVIRLQYGLLCCSSTGNSSSETTRSQRLACRRSRKSSATVIAPSSVTSRNYNKTSRRTRPSTATSTCLLVDHPTTNGNAARGSTPREMNRPGPEGQRNPPGGHVEASDELWSPRSNATAPLATG